MTRSPAPEDPDRADHDPADAPAVPVAEAPASGGTPQRPAAPGEAQEWWSDPSLPWAHKPTRMDLFCWFAIMGAGLFSLALLPLRPQLIANPYLGAYVTGGRTAMITLGAFLRVEGGPLLWYWLVGTLSLMKLDWIYWLAGRLWGEAIITSFSGQTERARRRARRALRVTERFSVLAILITYLPVPFPAAVVYAAVGAARMRLWVFLLIHLVGSGTTQAVYLWLGWSIGQPAVDVAKVVADYMWYLTLALLGGMLVTYVWRRRRSATAADA